MVLGISITLAIALVVLILFVTAYISWCFKKVTQENTTSFSKRTIRILVIADVLLFVQEFLIIMAINGWGSNTTVVGSIAVLILPLIPIITTIIICIIKFKNAAHAKKT